MASTGGKCCQWPASQVFFLKKIRKKYAYVYMFFFLESAANGLHHKYFFLK